MATDQLTLLELSGDDDGGKNPERRLWRAIVWQAFSDAFYTSDYQIRVSEENKTVTFDPGSVRREARRWLLADYGEYPGDRQTVCDFADVDEERVRNTAAALIEDCRPEDEKREADYVSRIKAKVA